jgi:hypothetical protein
MKLAAPVCALLLLAACGGSSDEAEPATAVAESTVATVTSTTGPVTTEAGTNTTDAGTTDTTEVPLTGKADDPKVRAKVKEINDEYLKEYDVILKEAQAALGGTDEGDPVDESIKDACEAAPNDGKMTDEQLGMIALFVGQILAKHGKDVATFAKDIAEHNRAIIKLGVCA